MLTSMEVEDCACPVVSASGDSRGGHTCQSDANATAHTDPHTVACIPLALTMATTTTTTTTTATSVKTQVYCVTVLCTHKIRPRHIPRKTPQSRFAMLIKVQDRKWCVYCILGICRDAHHAKVLLQWHTDTGTTYRSLNIEHWTLNM